MDYNGTYNYYSNVQAPPEGLIMAMIGLGIAWLVFLLVIYIYFAICLLKIAKRTNTPNGWMAWIPLVNVILMLQIAKKPLWWIILFFIPIVNIVIGVLVWMGICDALGKPNWLGILSIVPVANIILPGYLAFSKAEDMTAVSQ